MKLISKILMLLILVSTSVLAQQDPQYTQYMYNTMVLNPAYTGTNGYTTITALARTQWVGFTGAPDSQNISYQTQLGFSKVGLGFNIVNDEIGPSSEISLDANLSYSVATGANSNLAFGLKLGGRFLSLDPSKGNIKDPGDKEIVAFNNNFMPTIGAGVYYYTDKMYLGASIPNLMRTEHYDDTLNGGNVGVERFHMFFVGGYVFDLSEDTKFKPTAIVKAVSGAPLSFDVSGNFLFYERYTAGLAWRWNDSVAAILGFQASERLFIGYSYDLTTSNYSNYNSGTHEIVLRLSFLKKQGIVSPRFF